MSAWFRAASRERDAERRVVRAALRWHHEWGTIDRRQIAYGNTLYEAVRALVAARSARAAKA